MTRPGARIPGAEPVSVVTTPDPASLPTAQRRSRWRRGDHHNKKGSTVMPAHVESMFSVREMPWHRQGVVTGEYPGSWADARLRPGRHEPRWHTALPGDRRVAAHHPIRHLRHTVDQPGQLHRDRPRR